MENPRSGTGSMKVSNHLSEDRWRAFVDRCPQGNIFHTPEMFEVFKRTAGYDPRLWAVADADEQVMALFMPVTITLKDGPLRRLTSRAVSFGSVLFDDGRGAKEALQTLLSAYRDASQGNVLFTELRNLSDLTAIQPLLKSLGFVYEDHLNYIIDLDRSAEEVLRGIGSRTRKHIRRGLRKGDVVVEEVVDREQVALCYHLIARSYSAAGIPLAPLSMFEATFDILYPRGMVKFWLARIEEAYAAASVELLYKDTVYGWYAGLDRRYSSYMPTELLMWQVLEWSVGNGFKVYDFGGAGKPDEEYGVRDFKAKFGGNLVGFGRNTCVHDPFLLRLSEVGYGVYRHLLPHLPLWRSIER
jgi:serine/alanine adding enzyme